VKRITNTAVKPTAPSEPRTTVKLVRCASFTRKSSEEGLEREFDSLDAQREAGEAFVRTQAGAGNARLPQTAGPHNSTLSSARVDHKVRPEPRLGRVEE
jgi:hypothetical protein